jgi:hypothetical protein
VDLFEERYFGLVSGASEAAGEFGVSASGSVDGGDGAADVLGGDGLVAAEREDGEDFGALGGGEDERTAVFVCRGIGGGFGVGKHGVLSLVNGVWGVGGRRDMEKKKSPSPGCIPAAGSSCYPRGRAIRIPYA